MRIRLVLVLVSLVVVLAACGKKKKEAQLASQGFRLANGLEVELVSGPCGERAAVVLTFAVGADHDPPDRAGMTALIARVAAMAPGGDPRTVDAGATHTLVTIPVARDGLLAALDREAKALARLELPADALARGKQEVLAALAQRRGGDPRQTAEAYAAEAVQPSRGNGWRGGIAAEIEAITAAELDAFWRAHYQPANARLLVVGRFDPAAVRAHVEAAFGALPAGTPPVLRPPSDATVTGTLVMGAAPAAVAVAVPAPPLDAPLYPAFLIHAARLLPMNVAGSLEVRYDPLAQPETLFVTAAIPPGTAPEPFAAELLDAMARRVAPPLTAADAAILDTAFGPTLGHRTVAASQCKADALGFAVLHARRTQRHLDRDRLAQALAATTPAQLTEAAAFFDRKRIAAVLAGGAIR